MYGIFFLGTLISYDNKMYRTKQEANYQMILAKEKEERSLIVVKLK